MSTLRVSSVRNASSATGGLDIAADGSVSGALPSPNRNLLYNGAMQVAQRGTSATGVGSFDGLYHTADRWQMLVTTLGTWTQDIQNDAPTGSGFRRSLRMLCTTADAAPAAGDRLIIAQPLEGQDLQRIAKGTSSAQRLTLSFWVKSNVTGTFIAALYDGTNDRQVGATYTISASATWERKTITFPADTTGSVANTNALGMYLLLYLGAGSNRTSGTLQTSWAANVAANECPGQVNLAAATNNYWQITGVQLEVGDTATEFEHLPFGVELARCQRYYFRYTTSGAAVTGRIPARARLITATAGSMVVDYPQPMRDRPSALEHTGVRVSDDTSFDSADCTLTLGNERTNVASLISVTTSGGIAGTGLSVLLNSNSAYIGLSAEL